MTSPTTPTAPLQMPKAQLQRLIILLEEQGYTVLGPTVQDAAIVYAQIHSLSDLPRGYSDTQQPGQYRVAPAGHDNYFEFNLGPHSWKQFLFPPRLTVATAHREGQEWTFETPQVEQPKFAFLGVRACELAAIAVQDRVFLQGPFVDATYQARRDAALIVAVNCTVAAATCFCTSMQTGPQCRQGFDLALTELDDRFVIEVGSPRGAELVEQLRPCLASATDIQQSEAKQRRAAEQISKKMDTDDIRNLLLGNLDHPQWDDVANRCLGCTNCTMVCPTCFCSSVSEVSDLDGEHVERQRQWDSCFNIDFSYTAGGTVRNDRRSRFRQWLTHKLASWHDQFDSSGCVGCGRCITWCPVGIDLTAEVAALRESPAAKRLLPIAEPPKTACILPREVPQ
ncbi:MAG: 4Fe-4S dicluster domain-containing protein [Planctomycetales bacterium]|nr:4Fe-4S dicluster domain-containing protein [Planctomycetales bacterium]